MEVIIARKTICVYCAKVRSTPTVDAINIVAKPCMIAVPSILIVAPTGTTKDETSFFTPKSSVTVFNVTGIVAADEDVEKEAYKTAELICEGAPKVARWHKQFAKEILKTGKVTSKLNNLGYKCYDTKDFRIGYKSFLTKTKPKFKNK